MTDSHKTPANGDMQQVMRSIGELTGAVKAMHEGTTARIEDIRRDIQRLEQSTNDRVTRTEAALSAQIKEQGEALSKRMDSQGKRIEVLEAEDKRLIEKTAKLSAAGGAVGGMLAAAFVELLKRTH